MKNRLRILMTIDAVGGVWTYARDLIGALPEDEYQFLVAGMGPAPKEKQLAELLGLPHVQWENRSFALEWMDSPWEEVDAAGKWLLKLADDFSPHVVHLNGYSHVPLSWPAPVLSVAHSCVLSWWRAVRQEQVPSCFREYEKRIRQGLSAADVIIAPSNEMALCLEREYGLSRDIKVIPNGRPRRQVVSRSKENFILAAGRLWDEAKNVRLLDAIALELHWPVWIAGETRQGDAAFHATSAQLLGHLDENGMSQMLTRAAIFASPAFYEPFGLAILEAAAHDCALVLSDIPSLRENWNGAAIFVPPRDEQAWRLTLNHLIGHPARLAELQCRARDRARAFTSAEMGRAYDAIYRDLAELSAVSDPSERMVPA